MASTIEKMFKDSELQTEFLKAKITANPFDYKISNKVLFYNCCSDVSKYNIFNKFNNTENQLADLLKLKKDFTYLEPDFDLLLETTDATDIDNFKESVHMVSDSDFVYNLYNNLIIREDRLIELYPLMYDYCNLIPLRSSKTLEGIEAWFLKSVASESLIPHLLYLNTKYKNYILEDIVDLKFAKELITDGHSPIVPIRDDSDYNGHIYLNAYAVPGWNLAYDPVVSIKTATFRNIQKISVGYTISYLMELMYTLKDLISKYPNMIDFLKYEPANGFCEYFYSIVGDDLEINPELGACFDIDNTIRFNNFKNYQFKIFSKMPGFNTYDAFYKMPMLLNQMLCSMHQYAIQQCRIKHLILLYTECKNRGIDLKSEFDTSDLSSDDFSLPGMFGSSEDMPDELLNLEMANYSKTTENDDNADILGDTKKKETAPTLDAVDALKYDLHNSPYDFDVHIVKSKTEQQEAYNNVANNIKMLTVNLSKQIKEIKVYNTGGKNNGQSRGKLDKKNLWKYRTDHNIFYNNNYKIKEMDLAFGIILDESGSMCGSGIKNGRVVMILLHEVLTSLGINHSIVGHTSNHEHHCVINKYYQFKEELGYTLQKPYALADISSKNGNCDSGSLYYMQSVMKQVHNKDKIVIIFSDGEPTECSEVELKQQVRDMEKEGVHVIGVGINFDSIKEYYPDNANGKNLKEMIDIVVSILKRYVLEKD